MSYSAADHEAMAEALRLAARGQYTTQPNPRVGSVIVRDGEVVGRGWHQRAGEAHAEVLALQEAGERARGATVYVTLEPCAHHGRTPPCAEALARAGVARVVSAVSDPNPSVAGRGCTVLADAGIDASVGLMQEAAVALNPGYFRRHEAGRPWVRIKSAMSLDGRTAMASGESMWITGAAARRDVQHWRARSCALMTGIGTVLADDPRLNLRADEFPGGSDRLPPGQPLRVVLDTQLRLPPGSRLVTAGGVLVFADDSAADRATQLRDRGVEVVTVARDGDGLDLAAVLRELGRREVNEVQVEAGPTLTGRMLGTGLVDELLIYIAPRLLGSRARPLFDMPLDRMSDSLGLRIRDTRYVGADLRLVASPD